MKRGCAGRAAGFPVGRGIRVALQAQEINVANAQHVRVGTAVRDMTRLAALNLHRFVLKNERPLFVRVAGKTNLVLRRRCAHLLWPRCAMRIVAIRALHQPFVHAMMKGHLKLGLLLQVAAVAKLRLLFDQ